MAKTATGDNVLTMATAAKEPVSGTIVEILSETNVVITDAPALECNDGTTHKISIRDSLSEPKFRSLNQGSPIVNSGTRERREHTGVLENWVEADSALLELSDRRQVLMSQAKGVLEGMSQAGANAIFYADHSVDQAAFDGFTPRYDTLNPDFPESRNVISAGGVGIPDVSRPGYTTNLTSLWLVQWEESACHLIYPRGTSAGVSQEIFDKQVLRDSRSLPFSGIMVHYKWYLGLAVSDWRRVVRICNIDANQLTNVITGGAPTAADWKLLRLMQYAISLLPTGNNMRTSFYCNRIPHTLVSMLASEKSNVSLTYEQPTGRAPISAFQGIKLGRCDGIIIGEKEVTV